MPALLEWAATHDGAGLALLDRSEQTEHRTWTEILEHAHRVAGGLQAVGVGPGDRVILVYPTSWAFFDAFFGVLLAGAVPAPVYPPVRLGRLAEYHRRTALMIRAAGAVVVLADPRVRRILGRTVLQARPPLGCRSLDELPVAATAPVPAGADDLALVQFSSGTTAEPKPVALSHRALLAQPRLLNDLWPDTPEVTHRGVSWLPLYHDMGLIGCVLPALERPGPLTLIPPERFVADPAVWLRTISRCRATLSPAPNFAYGLCVEKVRDQDLDGVDLSCWRVALNGAEAVEATVLRAFCERFERWGFRAEALTPVYGLSEAALAVTFSDPAEPFISRRFDRDALVAGHAVENQAGRELVSVGRALEGFEVRVVDRDGQPAPAGGVGEVWVRGPSLMREYLGRPEATAEVLRDGWLATGDLGFVHDDQLFLTGRAKDVLILRGRNHSPEEVERTVDLVPGVRTGCSVAVGWQGEGAATEALVLLVEARRGTPVEDYPAIAEACARAVLAATGLVAESVQVLPPGVLPRTSSGKLRRQESLRQYRAGELAGPQPVTVPRMVGAVIGSALAFAREDWQRRGQS